MGVGSRLMKHKILAGQSTSTIAALHGVDVEALVAANPGRPLVVAFVGAEKKRVFAALTEGEELNVPVGVAKRLMGPGECPDGQVWLPAYAKCVPKRG